MTIRRFAVCALFVLAAVGAAAYAAGVAGKWTAAIDTQIGVQNYTYDFKVDGEKLTGTAKSQFSDSPITEGTVKGDDISFVENLKFEGQEVRVVYKGKLAGDEIKFNRQVGEFASEDFVAKRAK
jgi:major membrane immunogen (membrane-anchored lipoprotein)